MSGLLDLAALVPALIVCALAAFYALIVIAGVFFVKRPAGRESGRIAVIVPAHDEEKGVARTIGDILPQLRSGDRIMVVADNCEDATAAVARAAGAEVVERRDAARRGKGYALQFAIDSLRADPPEIVCIVDADCRVEPGSILSIARVAAAGRPAQALDLMVARKGADPQQAVAEFAWLMMNKVRMAGLSALFDTARLCGTGMAFPWALLEGRNLASDEIVEDLALGLDLAAAGAAPAFSPDALVTSEFPATEAAGVRQRARWERGSLRLAAQRAPSLLVGSLIKGDIRAAALAADIMIPPLTIFLLLIAGVLGFSLIAAAFGARASLPFAVGALALLAAPTICAWIVHGQKALPPKTLGAIAPFAMTKLRIHGAEGGAATRGWTRTDRGAGEGAPPL